MIQFLFLVLSSPLERFYHSSPLFLLPQTEHPPHHYASVMNAFPYLTGWHAFHQAPSCGKANGTTMCHPLVLASATSDIHTTLPFHLPSPHSRYATVNRNPYCTTSPCALSQSIRVHLSDFSTTVDLPRELRKGGLGYAI